MSLGLLVIFANVVTIYSYYVLVGRQNVNVFYVVMTSFGAMALLYILGMIPFGQVIENSADGKVATYYKLGRQKLKYRTLGQLADANLEQDSNRYYCLTIKTKDGQAFVLEKYPTLNDASQALNKLRTNLKCF